jgi:hypothetical protein
MAAGLLPPAQALEAKSFPTKHPPLQPAQIPTNKQEGIGHFVPVTVLRAVYVLAVPIYL